jgi:hydrogenase-1 operon protein HyaF
MTILAGIKILVEDAIPQAAFSENLLPLLHEIRHSVRRLLETGEPTTLDLNAIPFGPAEEEKLMATLGQGEIEAHIEAMGRSRVWETRYPGVWVVEHKNPAGERIALQVEITEIPTILKAQDADIRDGLDNLSETLSTDDP